MPAGRGGETPNAGRSRREHQSARGEAGFARAGSPPAPARAGGRAAEPAGGADVRNAIVYYSHYMIIHKHMIWQ